MPLGLEDIVELVAVVGREGVGKLQVTVGYEHGDALVIQLGTFAVQNRFQRDGI